MNFIKVNATFLFTDFVLFLPLEVLCLMAVLPFSSGRVLHHCQDTIDNSRPCSITGTSLSSCCNCQAGLIGVCELIVLLMKRWDASVGFCLVNHNEMLGFVVLVRRHHAHALNDTHATVTVSHILPAVVRRQTNKQSNMHCCLLGQRGISSRNKTSHHTCMHL